MRPSRFYEPSWVSRWGTLLKGIREPSPRFSLDRLDLDSEEDPEMESPGTETPGPGKLRW